MATICLGFSVLRSWDTEMYECIYEYLWMYVHAYMYVSANAPHAFVYTHMCVNVCIFNCLILIVLWHREVIFNQKETRCLPLLNAGFEPWKSETPNRQQTKCPLTNRLRYRGLRKPWTQEPVPMMSEHSAHLTSLPELVHPWLWRYTYLLFDFEKCDKCQCINDNPLYDNSQRKLYFHSCATLTWLTRGGLTMHGMSKSLNVLVPLLQLWNSANLR